MSGASVGAAYGCLLQRHPETIKLAISSQFQANFKPTDKCTTTTHNRSGNDDLEDDGTDAAARRRRARLLGTLDDDSDEEGALGPHGAHGTKAGLDFEWREDEEEVAARAAAAAADAARYQQRKQLAAAGSEVRVIALCVGPDSCCGCGGGRGALSAAQAACGGRL